MPGAAALPTDNIPDSHNNIENEKGLNGVKANNGALLEQHSSPNKDARVLTDNMPMSNEPKHMDDTLSTSENDSDIDDEENEEEEEELEEDDEGGQDEDGEAEEDDEDEEEPALKYERITGFLPDMFKKDSASALAMSNKTMILGTHGGIIHLLDLSGTRLKSFKPHTASICDIAVDNTGDFIGTASMDGQVVLYSLSTPESYAFDLKRPMRTIALEPNFANRSSRAFVCGGLSGTLVLHEKGWLGHKSTTLYSGEGAVWLARWYGRLIAWAVDSGVIVYDTESRQRIAFLERSPDSPRADLFKCSLTWQDDVTLLIAWADTIKVARVRTRTNGASDTPPIYLDVTAVFQLDCMVAGIASHPTPTVPVSPSPPTPPNHVRRPSSIHQTTLSSLLILAYSLPDTSLLHGDELTDDRIRQARKAAERPELRIISRAGEELSADALGITQYQSWGCNDYILVAVGGSSGEDKERCYVVLSPRDVILAKPRDKRDRIAWLLERRRYEEALEEVEKLGDSPDGDGSIDAVAIGQRYIEHLITEEDYVKAARLCPKVCGTDAKRWEDWIFVFAQKGRLETIIPFVPTHTPRLSPLVYNMMLAHFLVHDSQSLLRTIKEWPKDVYDISAAIVAINSQLEKSSSSSKGTTGAESSMLMECLAELHILNRQPGKALTYLIRLRRPNVFETIREHNLYTDVQDQALLLVEFDQELRERRVQEGEPEFDERTDAISLLVDHIHSIPIGKVVQQLQKKPRFLFFYLKALFERDPQLTADFSDEQVKLYAEYAGEHLIEFLRASNYYNLESAYQVCKDRDLVPEMVFLLGRMGNNKKALTLIIERLGDVNRAIEFAKEQSDDDLWEDLLKYSETRPAFIRGLLENVGADIDPIRLIRRIKNGLEIPGLKEALIKILHDFQLQISLLEGCQSVLESDGAMFAKKLQRDQTSGFFLTVKTTCPVCSLSLQQNPQQVLLLYLCRHVVHAGCAEGGDALPTQTDGTLASAVLDGASRLNMGAKIAFNSMVRARIPHGCPVCLNHAQGRRL